MIIDNKTLKKLEAPAVLIVDDQPMNLNALEAMLEGTDCKVVRAHSADEALLLLLQHDFAAIVLDIKMPGVGGIELATLIKQRKRSQHIPILFLTAYMVDQPDVLRGYGVGAVDFLSKPIDAGILRSKIGVFIDLYRKSRALGELNGALHREIADRQQAQEALQLANQELERRVQERTAELTRAHQGVQENEERLRMAMEVARIGAWEWHLASGRMTWSTDPEVLFGFPRGSFGAELNPVRMLHPDDKKHTDKALTTALRTGTYEAEYRAVRPDGGIVWFKERGRVVVDADGRPERMVGITRDVTAEQEAGQERERLLREAREARDEAQQANRAKDEFLAMLSHELRTPLNAILGWAVALRTMEWDEDTRASGLETIERNAVAQTKLIEDILDVSGIINGKLRLEIQQIDFIPTIEAAVAAVRPAAEAKEIELLLTLDPSAGPLFGDPNRLQQIVWNLLSNAIKFTPRGGQVQVGLERTNTDAVLRVIDTGEGIDPGFLPYVFDRFRQADSSNTRPHEGLGLGLSIVRHLVELHGGIVQAHSLGKGKGSTFTVFFPFKAVFPPR
ncbi:MAG: response regulator [Nitrospirae bacterium]|nr:response regulator [Candidatus Manganitrophaceae bacterium]